MSKYIKLEGLKWHSPDESLVKPLTEFYVTESDIADLPTIDIVRCEDCMSSKVYRNDSSGVAGRFCEAFRLVRMVTDDDYCSYGERKDNE